MNNLNKFLLIFFIYLTSINVTNSQETAFIDIDYIMENSNIGKRILENINKLDKENIENLKRKNQSLQELEITINNKRNIISEEAFKKEVILYQSKINEYKEDKNKIVKNFNDFKRKELENVFKKITPIINNYMEENSVSVLFDSKNIFMGSKKSNITEDILERINKEFK
jgi:outer membrane protein